MQEDTGARLLYADGTEDFADIVIGADVLGSVVRRAVTRSASTNLFAGHVGWRGLFPETALPRFAAEAR